MYVSGIGFSNVKGFTGERAVHELPLPVPKDGGSWTVLAGRNGSGKSTLLRTLALALAGPQVARTLVQDFGSWITVGEPSAQARVHVQSDHTVDRLTGRGGAPGDRLLLGLDWTAPEDRPGRPDRSRWIPAPTIRPTIWCYCPRREPTKVLRRSAGSRSGSSTSIGRR
ncbi:hypothetical protein [Streptomyces tauricus]|uniref:hypothetical protein n=1 Tax=Streptomyces tauricus TaxID=68274 RepID=UPI003422464A